MRLKRVTTALFILATSVVLGGSAAPPSKLSLTALLATSLCGDEATSMPPPARTQKQIRTSP